MKNLIVSILFFSVIFFTCSKKECNCIKEITSQKLPEEYKTLVNRAIFNYQGNFFVNNDTIYIDSAIFLLDKAINLFPKLFPAYYYKSVFSELKGDYYSIIETVDSATNNTYLNPDILFLKAKALDHLGKTEESDNILKEVETLYSQWISCYPDSINLIAAKIEFTAYYKGKEIALKEANSYLRKHPNNELIKGYIDLLIHE